MNISGFLADPYTFRQSCEVFGATSLSDLIYSRLLAGSKPRTALVMVPEPVKLALRPILAILASHIVLAEDDLVEPADIVFGFGESLTLSLAESFENLSPGGTLIFLGYCGPRNGPSDNEIAVVTKFIESVPAPLLNEDVGDNPVMKLLTESDLVYPGCGTIEGKIDALSSDVSTFEMGGVLTYPLWRVTAGHMPYTHDEQVAFPLMAQVIERRLMEFRILRSGIKLVAARKP